ncbi:MAG: tRNA (adenosine(37)-N6)-threonylcarbamoyltransferase complex transferase subunit TsaD [Candidatus Paceibacterota bacterium]
MKILSIETSCDETAISIIEASGEISKPSFRVLANNLISQINIHQEFGGVYPSLAKREHAKNLPIVLEKTLKDANFFIEEKNTIDKDRIESILEREKEMAENLFDILSKIKKPEIDFIAVTTGPGLEPALWVGITFAKALAKAWNLPLVPVNHMEGHILSVLLKSKENESIDTSKIKFPLLSLLISGGHTEIILVSNWMEYQKIGQTVDDAVGEAFDKVARILGLPYPGGPEISRLAKEGKENKKIKLPRPMLRTEDYDFSFSGLKTAVLYLVRDIGELSEQDNKDIAKEFQTAVGDVFVHKIKKAIEKYGVSQIIVAGGVAANEYLRERFKNELNIEIFLPEKDLSTDNAIMIGMAGYFGAISEKETSPDDNVRALSSLSL